MPSVPSKKRKSAGHCEVATLEEVKSLGTDLLSSREHINNLPRLLSTLSSPTSPPECTLEALLSLQAFFLPLLPEIPSRSRLASGQGDVDTKGDPEVVYREWLRSRFDELVDSLITISASLHTEDAVMDVSLDALMEFVKQGKGGQFESAIFHKFLRGLVNATVSSEALLNAFSPKYFKYADICYHTYSGLSKIMSKFEDRNTTAKKNASSFEGKPDDEPTSERDAYIHSVYIILAQMPSLESLAGESGHEMWSDIGFSSKAQLHVSASSIGAQNSKTPVKVPSTAVISKKLKAKFAVAWQSFLRLPLPINVYKEVLSSLHQIVFPNIENPVFLCDFLTESYNIGGVISVMSLNGLFILMTKHGLEYPNYYKKLYALLTPTIFMAKFRARFFQLLDTSLKSAYLPAYLAAAFAKKLSRLALFVPPSGALIVIAIIHNLLRRHPSINFLVHKFDGGETHETSNEGSKPAEKSDPEKQDGVDPFIIDETDPVKSNAMRSSLWEMETLRQHYFPAVSRFVASLESDLTVRNKTSEVMVADFVSGSYATVFGSEIHRRIKQVPLAFYKVAPSSLFSDAEFPGWSFSSKRLKIEG